MLLLCCRGDIAAPGMERFAWGIPPVLAAPYSLCAYLPHLMCANNTAVLFSAGAQVNPPPCISIWCFCQDKSHLRTNRTLVTASQLVLHLSLAQTTQGDRAPPRSQDWFDPHTHFTSETGINVNWKWSGFLVWLVIHGPLVGLCRWPCPNSLIKDFILLKVH